MPGQLLFDQPRGDCHIKFGHVAGSSTFAIKVATGFYNNSKRGLAVNHGLILILDAETGAPIVLLKDDGIFAEGWSQGILPSGEVLFIEIDAKALNPLRTTSIHNAARMVESCATNPIRGGPARKPT